MQGAGSARLGEVRTCSAALSCRRCGLRREFENPESLPTCWRTARARVSAKRASHKTGLAACCDVTPARRKHTAGVLRNATL
eukprot:364441-Chlamydomonas_euryale.AAC.1